MSFPVPLSPVISIDRLAVATRSSFWRTSRIAVVCPKITDSGGKPCSLSVPSMLVLAINDIEAMPFQLHCDADPVTRICIPVANSRIRKKNAHILSNPSDYRRLG